LNPQESLIKRIGDASRILKDAVGSRVAVLTHNDADGIAAGGAFTHFLERSGTAFCCRVIYDPTREELKAFSEITADAYFLLDIGTGQMDVIREYWPRDARVVILDHHQPQGEIRGDQDPLIVNPELHGMDGGRCGCASVLSALTTFYASDQSDNYYLKLGVVGLVGDIQGREERGDINETLLELCKERGVVEVERDFTFFQMRNAPIHKALSWGYDPYIPGLSGREDMAVALLTRANIPLKEGDRWRTVKDLSEKEKERIVEEVVRLVAKVGVEVKSPDFLERIYGFPDEGEDLLSTAREFSATLNACGKMNKADLGLLIASGRRGRILREVRDLLAEKRKRVGERIEALLERSREEDGVLLVDGMGVLESSFVSTLSNFYARSPLYREKIVIVYADTGRGDVKISARAPSDTGDKDLNLGRILSEAAMEAGGMGGGHRMAAGATIPRERIKETLSHIVDRCSGGKRLKGEG
jgi:RecJ-like exonuclease